MGDVCSTRASKTFAIIYTTSVDSSYHFTYFFFSSVSTRIWRAFTRLKVSPRLCILTGIYTTHDPTAKQVLTIGVRRSIPHGWLRETGKKIGEKSQGELGRVK